MSEEIKLMAVIDNKALYNNFMEAIKTYSREELEEICAACMMEKYLEDDAIKLAVNPIGVSLEGENNG